MGSILIVDDNLMNMELLEVALEDYTILSADNALSGIARAKLEKPDLIFMDLAMPGMDGATALKILKSSDETCSIPVWILTAHALTKDREHLLKLGADEFITKPLDLRMLLEKVARFFDQ